MAPSSSNYVTSVTRGQPKRLSPNFLRRNGRNVIEHVLISFHSRDVFRALSRPFVRLGFRLFCARLAVDYLAVYSVLGRLINLKFNGNGNGGCVSLRYNSLFISLSLFTKGRKIATWNSCILDIRENLNYMTTSFNNFFSEFWPCLAESNWGISDSIDKLNSREIRRLLPSLLEVLFVPWIVGVSQHFRPCSAI